MSATSKKTRAKNRSLNNPIVIPQTPKNPTVNKLNTAAQSYDSMKYIKNDIKWSTISAGIVVIILIILYYLFR